MATTDQSQSQSPSPGPTPIQRRNPMKRTMPVPTFFGPATSPRVDPEGPSPNPSPTPSPGDAGSAFADEPEPTTVVDRAEPRPTSTSSVSKPSLADTAKLVAGLLGMVVLGGSWVVKLRTRGRGRLRQPTVHETDAIAVPLARIGRRHVPLEWLNADLADTIEAGAAVGNYLNAGPLIEWLGIDPNIPADLAQEGTQP